MKNKTKWKVEPVKGGFCVSKDGNLLQSVFTLKLDANKHKRNLKKVADAIDKKYADEKI